MDNVEARFEAEQEDKRDPLTKAIADAASEAYTDAEYLLTKMGEDGQRIIQAIVAEHGIEMMGDLPDRNVDARRLFGDDFVAYCIAKDHIIKATMILAKIYSGKSEEIVSKRH